MSWTTISSQLPNSFTKTPPPVTSLERWKDRRQDESSHTPCHSHVIKNKQRNILFIALHERIRFCTLNQNALEILVMHQIIDLPKACKVQFMFTRSNSYRNEFCSPFTSIPSMAICLIYHWGEHIA